MEPILYNLIVLVLASAATYLLYKLAAAHAKLKSLKKVVAEYKRANSLLTNANAYYTKQVDSLRGRLEDELFNPEEEAQNS